MQYDLEERTAIFGEKTLTILNTLKKSAITLPLIDQLVRSATSKRGDGDEILVKNAD